MHYEVEINVARKAAQPIWRPLEEVSGQVAVYQEPSQALGEMAAEGRRGFQVVRVEEDGTRYALRTEINGVPSHLFEQHLRVT